MIFATNNRHKLQEVSAILRSEFELTTPRELGVTEDIPETADTLEGNALGKARYVRDRLTGSGDGLAAVAASAVFADDTGLEVEALNGEPGVYSARYAGAHPTFDDNCRLLLKNLEGKTNRRARFRTVVALLTDDGAEHLFEGEVRGEIIEEYRGDGGFGYDPVFVPDAAENPDRLTFAQMSAEQKNRISHRARAIEKLNEFLKI